MFDKRLTWRGEEAYTHGMESAGIAVIYQDHHVLIVNKPAGIVIHPTYKHADGTFWDALLAYTELQGQDDWQPPQLPDEPEWAQAPLAVQEKLRARRLQRLWQEEGLLPRPCLLHRLDKDTSGIVALARTENARRHLVKQFHEHTIGKRYLAIVRHGSYDWARPRTTFTITKRYADGRETVIESPDVLVPADQFLLHGPLQRDPDERRRCIVGPDGQDSSTFLTVLDVENGFALLEVRPITGRTHQIRAHLAAMDYAIVGDHVYAPSARNEASSTGPQRQFLHAYSLELRNYPEDTRCVFVAPLPEDLSSWLKRWCPLLWQRWSMLEYQTAQQAWA